MNELERLAEGVQVVVTGRSIYTEIWSYYLLIFC
jgi:hypothetical protein